MKKLLTNFFNQGFPFGKMGEYTKTDYPFYSAQLLVRMHYFYYLYCSIGLFSRWDFTIGPQTTIDFIPPIAWLNFVEFPVAITIIRIFFIISSLLASIVPQWRWVRILAFIGALEFVSLYYSVLLLDVDWYVWLLTGFMLIFLPDGWSNPVKLPDLKRQKFLLVFWSCQAILLMTYFMAGIGKLYGAFNQISSGRTNLFDPQAGALHIANRLVVTYDTSPLGSWVAQNYLLAWPFFLGSVYLMLFSLNAAFKPSLHRLWGIALILFHISNYLTINIGFGAHILLNAILFILSPFTPPNLTIKQTLSDIPVFGILFRKLVFRLPKS
jgi:hypothetical protein